MRDIVPLNGSSAVKNPMVDLFRVPPTDLSIASFGMVSVNPFRTGINPVDFQIDPQDYYVDLSRRYFELELKLQKTAGGDLIAAEHTYLVNNLAHSFFKHIQYSTQRDTHQSSNGHASLQSLLGNLAELRQRRRGDHSETPRMVQFHQPP